MKKISLSVFAMLTTLALILSISTPAFAKNKSVEISEASATTNSVTVKGSTEALAVLVQVRDSSNDILYMQTKNTSNQTFEVTLDNNVALEVGTYTVFVADFEGGDWAKMEVTVSSSQNGNTNPGDTKPDAGNKTDSNGTISNDSNQGDNGNSGNNGSVSGDASTGDNSNVVLWSLLLVAGSAVVIFIGYKKVNNVN